MSRLTASQPGRHLRGTPACPTITGRSRTSGSQQQRVAEIVGDCLAEDAGCTAPAVPATGRCADCLPAGRSRGRDGGPAVRAAGRRECTRRPTAARAVRGPRTPGRLGAAASDRPRCPWPRHTRRVPPWPTLSDTGTGGNPAGPHADAEPAAEPGCAGPSRGGSSPSRRDGALPPPCAAGRRRSRHVGQRR